MGKVVVVTSGKGGVGKTTSTAALGAALATFGQNVVVVAGPDLQAERGPGSQAPGKGPHVRSRQWEEVSGQFPDPLPKG